MAKVITGTNVADTITVQESGIVVNAGNGNDSITVTAKSSKSAINGQGGNDTVTINGGAGNTIMTGVDNDIIIIYGGSSNVVSGNQGSDKITVSGGKNNKVYGGSGQDAIIVAANIGTDNKIYGEADSDTITVNGGEKNYINGGGGIDTISIAGGNRNEIYCERENDIITISGGSNNKVCGGAENDQITISKGIDYGNSIYGDAGSDKISLNSGKGNDVHGGSGNDNLISNGGSGNAIYGEKGNDTFTVNAGENSLNGGTGDDTYIINKIITSNDTLLIDQATASKNDTDVLKLLQYSVKDFSFYEVATKKENLVLQTKLNASIKISDWKNHPLKKIIFKDGALTASQVNSKTIKSNKFDIKEGGTYSGTSGQDVFVIYCSNLSSTGSGSTVTITGMNHNDSITGLNDYLTGMKKEDNDLVIYTLGSNKIIIKNYYSLLGSISFGQVLRSFTSGDGKINRIATFRNFIPGTDGEAVLAGTSGNDCIFGGSGTKSVYGEAGDDVICTGWGLGGGYVGNQIVFGGDGDDYIEVGAGEHRLYGGRGNDAIYVASSRSNIVFGGDDDDVIYIRSNIGQIAYGGKGDDKFSVYDLSGDHELFGGDGNDEYEINMRLIDEANLGKIYISNIDNGYTSDELSALQELDANGYNMPVSINNDREDSLTLFNIDINKVRFNLNNNLNLAISSCETGSTLIEVANWYMHPLNYIRFSNYDADNNVIQQYYTPEDINIIMGSTIYS